VTRSRAGRAGAALLVGALVAAACGGDDSAGPTDEAVQEHPAPGTREEPDGEVLSCAPVRPAEAGTVDRTLEHDGLTREYRLTVPAGYDGTEPVPLVLNLHGFEGSAAGHDDTTGVPEAAGERGWLVVSPQGSGLSVPEGPPEAEAAAQFEGIPFWNIFGPGEVDFGGEGPGLPPGTTLEVDDVGFLARLLDELEAELCVDADRLFATGHSNGAGMSITLACELGDRLAAVGSVAGVNLTGVCDGEEPLSVLAIHGDADEIVVYEGGSLFGFELGNPSVPDRMVQLAERSGCDSEPELAEVPDGVERLRWAGCDAGAEVELWTISGWGHGWPRAASPDDVGVIDATETVLDFFDSVTVPADSD
jgi:polyhydroxybutyrate depolymerase